MGRILYFVLAVGLVLGAVGCSGGASSGGAKTQQTVAVPPGQGTAGTAGDAGAKARARLSFRHLSRRYRGESIIGCYSQLVETQPICLPAADYWRLGGM